jgi:hypothetical protein
MNVWSSQMGRNTIHNLEGKVAEILNLYVWEKKSLREIARIFSIHPEVVKRFLVRKGCNIRHRAEAMKLWHSQKDEKK